MICRQKNGIMWDISVSKKRDFKTVGFRTKAERFLLLPVLCSIGLSWPFHSQRGWIDHLCIKQVPMKQPKKLAKLEVR